LDITRPAQHWRDDDAAPRVSIKVIDRCQNHVLGGSKVRLHYLHHNYANEKQEAWNLLAEYLSTLTRVPKT
jgi:hypothetical protein